MTYLQLFLFSSIYFYWGIFILKRILHNIFFSTDCLFIEKSLCLPTRIEHLTLTVFILSCAPTKFREHGTVVDASVLHWGQIKTRELSIYLKSLTPKIAVKKELGVWCKQYTGEEFLCNSVIPTLPPPHSPPILVCLLYPPSKPVRINTDATFVIVYCFPQRKYNMHVNKGPFIRSCYIEDHLTPPRNTKQTHKYRHASRQSIIFRMECLATFLSKLFIKECKVSKTKCG